MDTNFTDPSQFIIHQAQNFMNGDKKFEALFAQGKILDIESSEMMQDWNKSSLDKKY